MAPDEETPDQMTYIDDGAGEDSHASQGTTEKPYKSLVFAYLEKNGEGQFFVRDGSDEWKPATKSALKRAKTLAEQEKKKAAKAQELALRKKKEDEERERALEEAKKIVIEEDPSLPEAKRIKLWGKDATLVGQRVRVLGRIHRLRRQAHMIFITLRDGFGQLQAIVGDDLAKSYDAVSW